MGGGIAIRNLVPRATLRIHSCQRAVSPALSNLSTSFHLADGCRLLNGNGVSWRFERAKKSQGERK